VYATTTTTELFFRQAVGRLVRWIPGVVNQRAYLFIPDDARLRGWAHRIAETRRHSLRRDTTTEGETGPAPGELDELKEELVRDAEQLSLFAVISAVATETHEAPGVERPAVGGGAGASAGEGPHGSRAGRTGAPGADGGYGGGGDDGQPDGDDGLVVELPALERAGGDGGHGDGGGPTGLQLTRRERKARLRNANADVARRLVHKTGWSHAQVNAELNRLAGVRRVTEATLEQLERRLRQAEHWHGRL
jgi:hypothetical protein